MLKAIIILKPLQGHTGRRIKFVDTDKAIAIQAALTGSEEVSDEQAVFLATVDEVVLPKPKPDMAESLRAVEDIFHAGTYQSKDMAIPESDR